MKLRAVSCARSCSPTVMTFMMPAMMLIMNATSVGIVWVGGRYIDAGVIQTGDLIAFITYAMVIIMGFLMIGMISIMLPPCRRRRRAHRRGAFVRAVCARPRDRVADVAFRRCSGYRVG